MKSKNIPVNGVLTVFSIFFESWKLFFINIAAFLKLLAFPVLGQILGLFLVLICAFWFSQNFYVLKSEFEPMNNMLFSFLFLILIVLPGFIIFSKAFLDYLSSIYIISASSFKNTQPNGQIQKFDLVESVYSTRKNSYLFLLLLISIFNLFGLLFFIVGIFFTLIFSSVSIQAFATDESQRPFSSLSKSIKVVFSSFVEISLLLFLLFVSTYFLIPDLISWGLIGLNADLSVLKVLSVFAKSLPLVELNEIFKSCPFFNINLNDLFLAKFLLKQIVAFIVIGFTLPIRSISMCLFLKAFSCENKKSNKKKNTKKSK